jgi:cysteine desulfurase
MNDARPRIYLDHNATSPLRPEAREAIAAALDAYGGNPAALHAEGRAARAALERAREETARLLGCAPGEIVFTSGGSEGIAAAVRGVCDRAPQDRRRIVVSEIEHSAVLESARQAGLRGFEVVRVGCDRDGRVDAEALIREIAVPHAALAVLQWASN